MILVSLSFRVLAGIGQPRRRGMRYPIQWGQSYRNPIRLVRRPRKTLGPRPPIRSFFAVSVAIQTPPAVLLFGQFDPSGADGLPADAITCARLGCHAASALTAVTIQDTAEIEDIAPQSPEQIDDQARSLLEDMPVQAIKVGAVYTAEAASAIAQIAADYSQVPLVLHLGHRGIAPRDAADQDDAEDLLAAIFELLLPQADVVVVEHARLAGWIADGTLDASGLPGPLHALRQLGAEWALSLGNPARPGHRNNLLVGPENTTASWPWQTPPERLGDTGGVLAGALAAFLARGLPMAQAVEQAIAHADAALAQSFQPGMGYRVASRITPA